MLGDVLRFRVVENKSHRKSTSGILHALNSCPLCSRTQKTVSLSSCAAELHAIVSSASDGVYIRAVLEFALGTKVDHYILTDYFPHLAQEIKGGEVKEISSSFFF